MKSERNEEVRAIAEQIGRRLIRAVSIEDSKLTVSGDPEAIGLSIIDYFMASIKQAPPKKKADTDKGGLAK